MVINDHFFLPEQGWTKRKAEGEFSFRFIIANKFYWAASDEVSPLSSA